MKWIVGSGSAQHGRPESIRDVGKVTPKTSPDALVIGCVRP
jgi:hypothetical protein